MVRISRIEQRNEWTRVRNNSRFHFPKLRR
jgi:hypothetical protein